MRILHVCESLIGGPASYLEEILPYQIQKFGADKVALLAPANHRESIAASINCFVGTYERTGRNFRSILALALAIRKSIKRHDPDIVHLHSSLAGAIGRVIVRGMLRRPRVVYCAHCWAFDRPRSTAFTQFCALVERNLSRLTDAIVNISSHEEPLLRKAGFSLNNAKLIVSGIKDLASPPDARPPVTDHRAPLRLLFVGRLDSQKGIDLLLRDFALLKPGRATLRIVGAKIVDKGDLIIPPEVELLGWVPRDTLPALFGNFDALVMPSRWEGMPLLAIEALRSGLPLVCSNHGAFPYFIKDGVNGVLMDINTSGFLDSALTILENTDRPAMSAAARATYVAMFRQEQMNRDLIGLYDSLVQTTSQSKRAPTLQSRPMKAERMIGHRAVGESRQ
ncbi:glycosyltransferase CpsG [Rhodoplanes sp. Z2-YC6860]|nr:glycosyltransferase CpsG [Rhodoplanes sp. Z2-YC6860]